MRASCIGSNRKANGVLDDKKTVEAVLSRISARAKRRIELDELVRRWASFGREAERGYSASIYDYTNDLSVRDLLGEVISSLPPGDARAIDELIGKSDDVYRHATRVSARPLLPLPPRVHSWWWFRIPVQVSEELRRDLVAAGLMSNLDD